MYIFWLLFHLFCFLFHKLIPGKICIGYGKGLLMNKQLAISSTNDYTVHWYMYAPPMCSGNSVLKQQYMNIQHIYWVESMPSGDHLCRQGQMRLDKLQCCLASVIYQPIKCLAHCPLGNVVAILKDLSLNTYYGLNSWTLFVNLFAGECHRTLYWW